jgi:hypothetical protein
MEVKYLYETSIELTTAVKNSNLAHTRLRIFVVTKLWERAEYCSDFVALLENHRYDWYSK